MHIARIAADSLLAVSVLFLPWWFTFIAATVCFFLFESYCYEFLAAALAVDILYAVPQHRFGGSEFVVTIGALLILAVLIPMRRRMRLASH